MKEKKTQENILLCQSVICMNRGKERKIIPGTSRRRSIETCPIEICIFLFVEVGKTPNASMLKILSFLR